MNGPKSWRDYINVGSDQAGHEWKLTKTEGGTIKRVRESYDFGGGFGRLDSGGEILKTPKINHYKCSKCGATATREFDNDRGICIDDDKLRNLKCEEVMVRDIII